jgi:hypothetical protein
MPPPFQVEIVARSVCEELETLTINNCLPTVAPPPGIAPIVVHPQWFPLNGRPKDALITAMLPYGYPEGVEQRDGSEDTEDNRKQLCAKLEAARKDVTNYTRNHVLTFMSRVLSNKKTRESGIATTYHGKIGIVDHYCEDRSEAQLLEMHMFWQRLAYDRFPQSDWEYRLGYKYLYERNMKIAMCNYNKKGSLFMLITEKKNALFQEIGAAVLGRIGQFYRRRKPKREECDMGRKSVGFSENFIVRRKEAPKSEAQLCCEPGNRGIGVTGVTFDRGGVTFDGDLPQLISLMERKGYGTYTKRHSRPPHSLC